MRQLVHDVALVFLLQAHFEISSDLTTEHMGVCTMKQAIEDIAAFIKAMNIRYGFQNPKWVTFGGSYPGLFI